MRLLGRAILWLGAIGAIGLGAAFVLSGYQPGPIIEIRSPAGVMGQSSQLEFFVEAPSGLFSRIDAALEQEGRSTTLFSMDPEASGDAELKQAAANRVWIIRSIDRKAVPSLETGPALLRISASRPVMFGLRHRATEVTRELTARLEPPRVRVASLHHFVNHGGAEFVVFSASPADVEAGVRVGDRTYPAFPGTSVGITDPLTRVAFFALAPDDDLGAPVTVFARDPAGNEAATPLGHRAFAKPFVRSRIEVDDRFLARVVPQIAQSGGDLTIDVADPLAGFLTINGELRRRNDQAIATLAPKTTAEMLWRDAFAQLGNTAVQSSFADHRTYFYQGREVDRQVHLGFDLASVQQAPVAASNRGVVLFADTLGIYGNSVIVDHGLGVQSLYAHLSIVDVSPGGHVEKGHVLGRTGMTSLAGGDHLHFTMLVNGVAVNPVEWWDPRWMEDRVFRKVREAGGRTAAR
ncbi:MAG: M23 family metallopeptidase [Acidobacteriota bacterium]